MYFDWSPIFLYEEGEVCDMYCSQAPGGDQRARGFTFKDEWDTPGSNQCNGIKYSFYALLESLTDWWKTSCLGIYNY